MAGSDILRITGMASGLDVDSMVKTMMKAENLKVDKLNQDRQIVQWKQDMYRDLMGDLNTFKSTYFDILKSDNYMLSTRNYSSFDITSTMGGSATTAVTATATSGAVAGDYTVNVSQLATKTMISGNNSYNVLQASSTLNFPDAIPITTGNNDKLSITIDGTDTYGITLDAKSYSNLSELAANINSKLSKTDNSSDISSKVEAVVSKDGSSVQLLRKLTVDDSNKTLNLTLGTTNYSVTLDKGNYTLDELKTQITSKLASASNLTSSKVEDINSRVSISVSQDGTQLSFNGATTTPAGYSVQGLAVTNTSTTASGVTITGSNLLYNPKITSGVNDRLTVKIGANSYNIDLGTLDYSIQGTYSDQSTFGKPLSIINDLVVKIQDKLNSITDSNDPSKKIGDSLKVKTSADGTRIQFVSNTGSQISLSGNLLPVLGASSGTSAIDLNQSTSSLMSSLFDNSTTSKGLVSFSINDKTFNYDFSGADKYKSIADVMSEISSQANVNVSYSQLTRQFSINSSTTGSGQQVKASDTTGNFVSSLFGASYIDTSAQAYKFSIGANNNIGSISVGSTTYTAGTDFSLGGDIATTAINIASAINNDPAKSFYATSDSNGNITMVSKTTNTTSAPTINVNYTDASPSSAPAVSTISSDSTDYSVGSSNISRGKDASLSIKEPNNTQSISITKSTNNFTLDGVNYSLNAATSPSEVKVTLTSNPQKTFDKIKDFVDKYNDLIDKINTKLYEKKQYDYKPLTDDQKKDMKDEDIKAWEDKAKQGLLANDGILSNMLTSIRSAFYDAVKINYSDPEGSSIGIALTNIGITTSSDVSERGKLIIDETKLKDAIQNNGYKVTQLFTKVSSYASTYSPTLSSDGRSKRYQEEGIFQRVSDIFQDYLRTTRDNNGKKGLLLEKAGIKGDYSEYHNLLTDDLVSKDKAIRDLQSKLKDKENSYYTKFSKLEEAMQQMNTQSSWLSQQLGAMSK